MRRFSAVFLTLALIAAPAGEAAACLGADGKPSYAMQEVSFSGEVRGDEAFLKELAPGVSFRLLPTPTGWRMEIGPDDNAGPDYIYLATPPYIGNPVQHFDARFPGDPLAEKERRFRFIFFTHDAAAAKEAVGRIVMPKSRQEKEEAASVIDGMAKGSGVFAVRDGDTAESVSHEGDRILKVERLSFEAKLSIPSAPRLCN